MDHLETLAVNCVPDDNSLAKVLERYHFPKLRNIIYSPTLEEHPTDELRRLARAMARLPAPLESFALIDWDEYALVLQSLLEVILRHVKTIRHLTVNVDEFDDLLELQDCSSVEELCIETMFREGEHYEVPIAELHYFIEEVTTWKGFNVLKLPKLAGAQRIGSESGAGNLYRSGATLGDLEKLSRTKGIRIEWGEHRRISFGEVWEDLIAQT